jgi:hypothetical protein
MKFVSAFLIISTFLVFFDFTESNEIIFEVDKVVNSPEYLSLDEKQQISILKAIYKTLDGFKESEVMLDNIKKVPSKTKFKMRSKNVFVG